MLLQGKRVSVSGKRVALGMSGGVDSSVSAHLLVEDGYEVTGVYLECWRAPGCRTEEDRKDALDICLQLGIPFTVLDFKQKYKETVVEYFFREYEQGKTPNPDVLCNKEIKFGLFYDWAMENNFEHVATGHYAQVLESREAPGQKVLLTSQDEHKDQTYFLYRLRREQLEHILFPIGHLEKSRVRQMAVERNLAVASKKDSVGICFIGDINVHNFLKERLGEKPGPVIDTKGTVIGEHNGLWFFTVGQRHGFSIFPKSMVKKADGSEIDRQNIPPFYVIRKNASKNELVVGFGKETFQTEFDLSDIHWIYEAPKEGESVLVRIRHTGKLLGCQRSSEGVPNGKTVVKLIEPTQGIAEGQSAVFYREYSHSGAIPLYECLGGGVIGFDS